jgi:hypothetical protein
MADLTRLAEYGAPSQLENILGQYQGQKAAKMAERAIWTALSAKRWDNVVYLASVLSDLGSLHGGNDTEGGGADNPKGSASFNPKSHCIEYGIFLGRKIIPDATRVVINKKTIRMKYTYPLGPEGLIFTEESPGDNNFDKKDLIGVIAARYREIFNTRQHETWGHEFRDLILKSVTNDSDDLYTAHVFAL